MRHLTGFIFSLVFHLCLLPISMIVMTPVILIGAAFSKEGTYLENVKNGYGTVYHHWDRA